MQKDILSIKNIKADIRNFYKSEFAAFFVCPFLWLVFGVPSYFCFKNGGGYIIIGAVWCIPAVAAVGLFISSLIHMRKWLKLLAHPPIMVSDKLTGKAIEHPLERRGSYYRFYFSNYGIYETLLDEYTKIYTWSENFAMTPQRIFDRAFTDEEYYLLLDKEHSGKILAIYSKTIFQLETEQIGS
jgi:hypothetical protein